MNATAATHAPDALARARRIVAPIADEFPFEPHFLELDGHAYHYVDEGPRDAPAVLMVHGNPTWSYYWRHLVLALRGERRCIAVDHLGCGLSDKPQDYPYRLENHVDNLQQLITALDLREITLVAHDWGGPIGLGALRELRDRTRGLVLLNTAAFPGPAPLRIRACLTPVLGPFAVLGLNAFARVATYMAVERPMSAAVRRGFLAPYDTRENRVATLRFVQDIPLSDKHPSWDTLRVIEESLTQWSEHPICLVWGERDWCFTTHFLDEFIRRWPHAEVLRCPEAGHYVIEDARDEVLAHVGAFVDRTGATP